MSKINFSLTIPANTEKLIALATDYKRFSEFFESQLKSVNVIETNDVETITEEILSFSTYVKHEIVQRSSHRRIKPNTLFTKIIFGPFKNSELEIIFDKMDSGTKVTAMFDLKVALKYKLLEPIIKKRYKSVLTGLLYKMNTILQSKTDV